MSNHNAQLRHASSFITPVAEIKTTIFPKSISNLPQPLLLQHYINPYFFERHLRQFGPVPDIGFYNFTNVFVGPSGTVMSEDFKMYLADDIQSSYVRDRLIDRLDENDVSDTIVRSFSGKVEIIRFDSKEPIVSLAKPGFQVYGHWIIDILPMAWLILKFAETLGLRKIDLKFLVPSNTPDWALEILYIAFAINNYQIIKYDHTKLLHVKKLILPSLLRIEDYLSPEMQSYSADIVEKMKGYKSEPLPTKIFITRQGVKSFLPREISNIGKLEEVANSNGFTVLDPSLLPWHQQVQLFSRAETVVGPFGSGMHNTIYSKTSTQSLVLTSSLMNQIQTCISALRSQKMGYLFAKEEVSENGERNMSYDEKAFCECLALI